MSGLGSDRDDGGEILESRPLRSAGRRGRRLVAVGLVALALGAVAGLGLGQSAAPVQSTEDPRLVAGAVERLPDEYGFQIRLHNPGSEEVEVGLVYSGRRPSDAGGVDPGLSTAVPPAAWRAVQLHVPTTCKAQDPRLIRAIVSQRGGEPVELLLPLPETSAALREYFSTQCRNSLPPDRSVLVGLWVVADDYAFATESPHLWRFDDDGTFVADANGRLFIEDPGLAGTYRIEGRHLLLRVTGGYRAACLTGPAIDVDTARMPGNRLLFSFPDSPRPGGAGCALPTGVDWVLQRLAGPRGLPD